MKKKHTKFRKNDIVEIQLHYNDYISKCVITKTSHLFNKAIYQVVELTTGLSDNFIFNENIIRKIQRFNGKLKKYKNHIYKPGDKLKLKFDNFFINEYCKTYDNNYKQGSSVLIKEFDEFSINLNDDFLVTIISQYEFSKNYKVYLNDEIAYLDLSEEILSNYTPLLLLGVSPYPPYISSSFSG